MERRKIASEFYIVANAKQDWIDSKCLNEILSIEDCIEAVSRMDIEKMSDIHSSYLDVKSRWFECNNHKPLVN